MAFKFNPTTGKFDIVSDPGGSDTQVQFNDGGSFGGDSDLTYNKTTNTLTTKGNIRLDDAGSFTTTLQAIPPTATRTISLPDATGTVALVAGSSGQILYNNAGVNAGIPQLTWNSSTGLTFSSNWIQSTNGAASAPPMSLTGTWFTGGLASTTKPQLLIEPAGTTSTSWSTAGTGLAVNAASGFTGDLAWFGINGTKLVGISTSTSASLEITRADNHGIALRRTGVNPGSCIMQVTSYGACQFAAESSIVFSAAGIASVAFGLGNVEHLKLLNNTILGFGPIPGNSGNPSFPGLKRSGTALQVRLSDDSGYATIDAQCRLQGAAPASATATGTTGDVRYDADYIYICTATNTWKRAAIATW